jgi:lysyl-tRNA synthetase class 2
VTSSVIASVGYDPATATLEIELLDGAVYRYFAVPQRQVDELLTAQSIGRFYNQVIKPRYPYERLES